MGVTPNSELPQPFRPGAPTIPPPPPTVAPHPTVPPPGAPPPGMGAPLPPGTGASPPGSGGQRARRSRRAGLLAGAAAVVVAGGIIGGVFAFGGGKGDDDEPASTRSRKRTTTEKVEEDGGGGGLSRAELANAYEKIIGISPSSSTTSCLAKKVDGEDPDLADFLSTQSITERAGQRVFRPFLACAPDEDIATVMQVVLPGTDPGCVTDAVGTLSIDERTTILVDSWIDPAAALQSIQELVAYC